jgi:hypothetical protein
MWGGRMGCVKDHRINAMVCEDVNKLKKHCPIALFNVFKIN